MKTWPGVWRAVVGCSGLSSYCTLLWGWGCTDMTYILFSHC